MLDKNERFVIDHNKYSKIPTVNLSALRNSCAKIACCSSEFGLAFLYAGSSIQIVSEQFDWCIHFPFVNFAIHLTPQKIVAELGLEIQTALIPKPLKIFLKRTETITSETIHISC